MPSKEEKKANKVFLAARDMGEAGDYLYLLNEIKNNSGKLNEYQLKRTISAIIIAAIVVYSRHFTNTRSSGNAYELLKPEDINLFDSRPDLAELHKKVLTLRNQAIAHGDWNHYPTSLVQSKDDSLGFLRDFNQIDYSELIDITKFKELIDHSWRIISDNAFILDSTLQKKIN